MKKRVRAVIIQNGSLLLIHRIKAGKEYWVFPGGGLEESDVSPQEGLIRECKEELGIDVSVGDFFAEAVFSASIEKQMEIFYLCTIIKGELGTGKGPEFTRDPQKSGTYELQWVPITTLGDKDLLPNEIRDKVLNLPQ